MSEYLKDALDPNCYPETEAYALVLLDELRAAHATQAADIATLRAALEVAVKALREAAAILGGEYGDHYAVLQNHLLELEEKVKALIGEP